MVHAAQMSISNARYKATNAPTISTNTPRQPFMLIAPFKNKRDPKYFRISILVLLASVSEKYPVQRHSQNVDRNHQKVNEQSNCCPKPFRILEPDIIRTGILLNKIHDELMHTNTSFIIQNAFSAKNQLKKKREPNIDSQNVLAKNCKNQRHCKHYSYKAETQTNANSKILFNQFFHNHSPFFIKDYENFAKRPSLKSFFCASE